MDKVKKVNSVLQDVGNLTDEQIEETRRMAERQRNYAHPLKSKTAGEYQDKGKQNILILNKLVELRDLIKGHED